MKKTSFGIVGPFMAIAITIIALTTASKEPSGCYKIDDSALIALSKDEVLLVKGGKIVDKAKVRRIDQVRGYILYTDKYFHFDFKSRSATFESGKNGSFFVSMRLGERDRIIFSAGYESELNFYKIECDY